MVTIMRTGSARHCAQGFLCLIPLNFHSKLSEALYQVLIDEETEGQRIEGSELRSQLLSGKAGAKPRLDCDTRHREEA